MTDPDGLTTPERDRLQRYTGAYDHPFTGADVTRSTHALEVRAEQIRLTARLQVATIDRRADLGAITREAAMVAGAYVWTVAGRRIAGLAQADRALERRRRRLEAARRARPDRRSRRKAARAARKANR